MSVPLRQERRSEAALVVFTLLVPASVGVVLFAPVLGGGTQGSLAAFLLASIGMLGSITHLAKPLRAPTSLRNVKSSWLSREIAAVSLYWAFVLAWLVCGQLARHPSTAGAIPASSMSPVANDLALASGVVLLAVIERAYKVGTRPAWCGHECLVELAATALGAGGAIYAAVVGCPLGAASAVLLAGAVIGLVLDVLSHRRRRRRLEGMRSQSDERIPLTLKRYEELSGRIHAAWAIEAAAVLLMAAGFSWVAAALQLAAHAIQRAIFYDLPVQVRYAARLRK